MVQSKPLPLLLTDADLPETDNRPVDNELQILIPILLRAILSLLWSDRMDWFYGINLGVYYDPDAPAIGPDAFLSLGVQRFRPDNKLRLSYVVWQENNQVPLWALEVVSKTPGQEYGDKLRLYAEIGVLYYTIYNSDYWKRDRHEPFEVYHLVNGSYVRLPGNPVWMPEVGLGIGYAIGQHEGLTREWLYWYDQQGRRYPAPQDVIAQERELREQAEQQLIQAEQQLEQERQARSLTEQQLRHLLERLRQQGINPEDL